jgi:ATP-dependent exoDNAse (exonuclease V) beta subunit
MREDLAPVAAGAFRLMPEFVADGAVAPWPARRNEVRVATIHRFKGLESSVVVLAEIDSRITSDDLAGLLYVGATRARTHLVVIGSAKVLAEIGVE